MKLKEQLTRNFTDKMGSTESDEMDEALKELAYWAFESGFEKAKELALKIAELEYDNLAIFDKIADIGDEEV